jgi:hypothetical protein
LAKKFDPWTLYRLRNPDDPTGDTYRVTIHGYQENGELIVNVTGQFNLIGFGRRVYGIAPDDLSECDLPAAGEELGTFMNEEQTLEYINQRRAELGIEALTKEELDEIKRSDSPRCAIGGEAPEASSQAVPAQKAGSPDNPDADKT